MILIYHHHPNDQDFQLLKDQPRSTMLTQVYAPIKKCYKTVQDKTICSGIQQHTRCPSLPLSY